MKFLSISLFFISALIHFGARAGTLPNSVNVFDGNSNQEKYPDAEAVCVFDRGKVQFVQKRHGYDFDIEFKRITRIRIIKNSGVKYAEITVPFYVGNPDEKESIIHIEGATFNLVNGETTKSELSKDAIFEEILSDDYRAVKFVLPNVREGSVIEYTYTLKSPFLFSLPKWYFQKSIPTEISEYSAQMIPFYEYSYTTKGIDQFDYHAINPGNELRRWGTNSGTYAGQEGGELTFKDNNHIFVMHDIPAFATYPFLPCHDDFMMQMQFQLSKFHKPGRNTIDVVNTWNKLNQNLLKSESFGIYLNKSKGLSKKLLSTELDLNDLGEIAKSKVIIEFVKDKISHDGTYTKYCSRSPDEVIKGGYGNGAEINLLLTALLIEAGIEAVPVLISTKDHGRVNTDYPFLRDFNHVVVFVSNSFLADATSQNTSFSRLPINCLNGNGLLVTQDDELWVPLELGVMSLNNKSISIEIDPEKATASVTLMVQSTEYAALEVRNAFEDDQEKIVKALKELNFVEPGNIRTFNYAIKEKPYIIGAEATIQLEKVRETLFIYPFLGFPISENQLNHEKRAYPVDFDYPKSNSFEVVISIPDGYAPVEMPSSVEIDNGDVAIFVQYTISDHTIEAKGTYTFKKSMYMPDEYEQLQISVGEIGQAFSSRIALQPNH
jgi:hypothetical protein